jgi:6,7-dimethyl-8-ribityllumazine synthase
MRETELQNPSGRMRLTLIAGSFNRFVTDQLVEGAVDALLRNGVDEQDIHLVWVPGAFEMPLAADQVLSTGSADAVVALGAVIRGGTAHFEYVAGNCARGLADVSLKHGKPVIFGVLTTETVEQALERAGSSEGNKGFDCAIAALQMLGLQQRLASAPLKD